MAPEPEPAPNPMRNHQSQLAGSYQARQPLDRATIAALPQPDQLALVVRLQAQFNARTAQRPGA